MPALATLAAEQGTKVDIVVRPINLTTRTIGQTIAVIAAMASEQRDNPQLLRQNPDSAFVRNDTLRGTPVEVLRYAKRTVLWLATDDGRMLRFEGNNEAGTRPLVFDALQRGPQTVADPPSDGQVSLDQVQVIYDAAIASAG